MYACMMSQVHARNKPLSPDIDLEQVARRTPGLAGASLKNLMNEAAIHAARTNKEIIEWDDVDWAIDRVTVGLEKPNKDALVQDIELVAFHEVKHAHILAIVCSSFIFSSRPGWTCYRGWVDA